MRSSLNLTIEERRFRHYIVLELTPSPLDQYLLGEFLQIGEVRLKVTEQAERCRMATMAQAGLVKTPRNS